MKNKISHSENRRLILPFFISLLLLCVTMIGLDYAYRSCKQEFVYSDYSISMGRRIQEVVCDSSTLWLKLLTSQISFFRQECSHNFSDFLMQTNYIVTGIDIFDPKSFLRSQVTALGSYRTGELDSDSNEVIPKYQMPIESAIPDDITAKVDNGAGMDIISSGSVVDYFASDSVVLIYHTHTTEAYLPDSGTRYNDHNDGVTVVKVGKTLTQLLNDEYHIPAKHVTKNHVWEPFWASYTHSLQSVETALQSDATISYVIDIHNDGIERDLTTTTIDGEKYARLYFVIGADSKRNPRWRQNEAFAKRLQEKCEQRYPGLSRGILLRETARYNQHLCDNSLLVEMGGYKNYVEEAIRTTHLLAELLAEIIIEDVR